MSDVNIDLVLGQMRAMATAASGRDASPEVEGAAKLDFGAMMKDSIEKVSETQMQAKELATAFESGDTSAELPEVMVAMQKASISFQAMTQVRNKLLSAYQEVMNMQV